MHVGGRASKDAPHLCKDRHREPRGGTVVRPSRLAPLAPQDEDRRGSHRRMRRVGGPHLRVRTAGGRHRRMRRVGGPHLGVRTAGGPHRRMRRVGGPHLGVRTAGGPHRRMRRVGGPHLRVRTAGGPHRRMRRVGGSHLRVRTAGGLRGDPHGPMCRPAGRRRHGMESGSGCLRFARRPVRNDAAGVGGAVRDGDAALSPAASSVPGARCGHSPRR